MNDNLKAKNYGIRAVEEFSNGLTRDREIIVDLNNGSASRLVWLVAIAGFAFLNVRTFAEAVAQQKLSGIQITVLSTPWALTAMFGIIAHWALGSLIAKDNVYYILKQHSIRAFLATAEKRPSVDEVLKILNVDETERDVAQSKLEVDRYKPFVDWMERFTFIFLLVSMAWSLIYPLVIKSCR